ncbi:MAG: Crp/Fnr family transcriptional regulator [Gammaproteobacteria bacterium]|nr:Crp/Fnr family transcriptional regulator [Gammaproteobacteria bacterium]
MDSNDLKLVSEQHFQAIDRLFVVFPQLAERQNQEWLDLLAKTQSVHYPANAMLVSSGAKCTGFMVILEGSVRIFQHADDGREVTLYRMGSGDICLMSLNSLMHNRPFRGNAKSETEISALTFDPADFHRAMKVSDAFCNLVLTNLVDTVCSVVHMLHETSFESLDTRLSTRLNYLFEQSASNSLSLTHQALAQELGSSREVISRLLKKMENKGLIILKRGEILQGKNKSALKVA